MTPFLRICLIAFATLFVPNGGEAAWTSGGHGAKQETGSGTSTSVSLTQALPSGNVIACGVWQNPVQASNQISSITDDKGNNSYVVVTFNSATISFATFWSGKPLTNTPTTVTVNFASSLTNAWMVCDDFVPPAGTNTFTIDPAGGGAANGSNNAPTASAFTTTANGDLVYAATMSNGNPVAGTGFTLLEGGSGFIGSEWQAQSTAGSISPSFTATTGNWGIGAFAIKATTVSSASSKPIGVDGVSSGQPVGAPTSGIFNPISFIGGGSVSTPFTATHTFFMASTGCNDANAGTSSGAPWCTPNHAVNCGDVIIAAAGTYSTAIANFGAVSNCPSTTGGIDGTGGIFFAVLLCGGADLNACNVNVTAGPAVTVASNNWAVEGFRVTGNGSLTVNTNATTAAGNNTLNFASVPAQVVAGMSISDSTTGASIPNNTTVLSKTATTVVMSNNAAGAGVGNGDAIFFAGARAFESNACASGTTIIHHNAFVNNITFNSNTGFTTNDCALNHNVPGNGTDYFAVVGNIAQAAAQDSICLGSIDTAGPANFDSGAGTHIFWYGNAAYNTHNATCVPLFDTENYIIDTIDAHGFAGQVVMSNNIGFTADRYGVQLFYQGLNSSSPNIKVHNNTFYADLANIGPDNSDGEINLNGGGAAVPWIVSIANNVVLTNRATSGSGNGPVSAMITGGGTWPNLTNSGNILKGVRSSCGATLCDSTFSEGTFNGNALGSNTYIDPLFTNTTDLLNNQQGAPTCTGFLNVTACMGWNAGTQVLTTPSIISDLQASCTGCSGKGYQLPSIVCAANAEYPTWLKGVVYLHWDGTNLTQRHDLVTTPCNL